MTASAAESRAALAPGFGVRWRAVMGPECVRGVPHWLIDDARNYKRRGLPLLRLWETTHYQAALGLSSRGLPGAVRRSFPET